MVYQMYRCVDPWGLPVGLLNANEFIGDGAIREVPIVHFDYYKNHLIATTGL